MLCLENDLEIGLMQRKNAIVAKFDFFKNTEYYFFEN
jgi:hypothetical protein